jgi:outer membrane protein assembly factor BamD (BamD/ComL family)
VAEFYMRDGNPVAAGQRAQYLVDTYPDATDVPNGLFLYARAMLQLGNTDEAVTALRRLSVEFTESPRGRDARRYLDEYGL